MYVYSVHMITSADKRILTNFIFIIGMNVRNNHASMRKDVTCKNSNSFRSVSAFTVLVADKQSIGRIVQMLIFYC